jgi:hypothetical protein
MSERTEIVRGTVEFLWESDQDLLVTIEPERPGAPHTFEISGDLAERLAGVLGEGARVEVEYVAVEHEVVDPDSGPSETLRSEVRDVRVLGDSKAT